MIMTPEKVFKKAHIIVRELKASGFDATSHIYAIAEQMLNRPNDFHLKLDESITLHMPPADTESGYLTRIIIAG